MLKVAVVGAAGKMGRLLIEVVAARKDMLLGASVVRPGSGLLGLDVGDLVGIGSQGLALTDSLEASISQVDVVVDFTRPSYTMENLDMCHRHGKGMVIGTTGFNGEQKQQIESIAHDIPVVLAPNMSIGINLVFKLLETAADILQQDVDVEVIEAHHCHKVDAPSGTAVKMGEIIADVTGRSLDKHAVYGREGHTGARKRETIGFSSIRAGDIVGDHTVLFAGEGERIEITHKASDRVIYAHGALRAMLFLQGRDSGLYDMQDVLGLKVRSAKTDINCQKSRSIN
ncbi:4-hydroxy-tetrahydrodipicolinate reductase [invertebrate metagenome]|uniref:4-hydroxy-tetrahydrodipicolinate reductase n=1 Tax=invertebrate metagenome TaxID=1711999 RepID=A0A2H9T9F8_9ZZZZ